jgi:phosphonate metabolism protein PhnN/1,5-bisphosphokinase (PRPP-forming)
MIVAVVGPSGAGKDSLIAAACAARPDLHHVRRVITRDTDAGGEDFDGVTTAEFASRKARGDFALDWAAHGLHYGIPSAQLRTGQINIFNGSRHVLATAQTLFPDLRVILVTAPVAVLAVRLAARGRETEADIAARLARTGFSLPEGLAVRTVNNDGSLAEGLAHFLSALQP